MNLTQWYITIVGDTLNHDNNVYNTDLLLGSLQRIKAIQNSRLSSERTQKKMKKRNPWNPLQMTNRYWNAVEASLTVRAPMIHVRPNVGTSIPM